MISLHAHLYCQPAQDSDVTFAKHMAFSNTHIFVHIYDAKGILYIMVFNLQNKLFKLNKMYAPIVETYSGARMGQ